MPPKKCSTDITELEQLVDNLAKTVSDSQILVDKITQEQVQVWITMAKGIVAFRSELVLSDMPKTLVNDIVCSLAQGMFQPPTVPK